MKYLNYINPTQYRFYYTTLSLRHKDYYNKLLYAFLGFKESVVLHMNETELQHLEQIYTFIKLDVPELFYLKNRITYLCLNGKVTIYPEYIFDEQTCINILTSMRDEAETIKTAVVNMNTEEEKIRTIHDRLVEVNWSNPEAKYAHEAPGAILYGVAVCEGIAKAFKFYSDEIGLQCIIVTGRVLNISTEEGHAWNMCKIDGHFYHIDATFDGKLGEQVIRYDYYLLSDKEISFDRLVDNDIILPKCADTWNYYEKMSLSPVTPQGLADLVDKHLPIQKHLVVQLPPFEISEEDYIKMIFRVIFKQCHLFENEGMQINISSNYARRIFEIFICS